VGFQHYAAAKKSAGQFSRQGFSYRDGTFYFYFKPLNLFYRSCTRHGRGPPPDNVMSRVAFLYSGFVLVRLHLLFTTSKLIVLLIIEWSFHILLHFPFDKYMLKFPSFFVIINSAKVSIFLPPFS